MIRFKCVWVCIMLFVFSVLHSQNSLDDLNVIFKHDFEDNTIGYYKSEEWAEDWNNPSFCNRQSELRIVRNSEDEVNPTKTLQLNFPEQSLGPSEGGTHWWTYVDGKYNELYFSYDVLFMPGFQFHRGGKLPGIKGGSPPENLSRPTGYDGFASWMMFKGEDIVFYEYFPDSELEQWGSTFIWGYDYEPTHFDPSRIVFEYVSGEISKGDPGNWHNITFRLVLNTVKAEGGGNYDGILEAYFDGKLVTQISNMLFRHTAEIGIDCITMMSFFGGGDDGWRNPIAEWLRFDNVILYSFKENINVPRGNVLSSTDRTINYWRNFGNPVTQTPDTDPEPEPEYACSGDTTSAFVQIDATKLSYIEGAKIQVINSDSTIGYLDPSHYVGYCNIDFGDGVDHMDANMIVHPDYTSDIEIRIDNFDGPLAGALSTTSTGDWETFGMQETSISDVTGVHDLYFVSNSVAAGNLDWFQFSNTPNDIVIIDTVPLPIDTIPPVEDTIPEEDTPPVVEEPNKAPIVSNQTFDIVQAPDLSSLVGEIIASDPENDDLKYELVDRDNNLFSLDNSSGKIYLNTFDLDFHSRLNYILVVRVSDPDGLYNIAEIGINLIPTDVIYYIDPNNYADNIQDGSYEHPYDSWSKVTWEENAFYYQKKGTTIDESKILVTASNVTLGSYGEGERAIINSSADDYAIRLFDKSDVVIKDLEINADKAIASISFLGENCQDNIIQNCYLKGAEYGLRLIDGKNFTISYNVFENDVNGIYSITEHMDIFYNIFKNASKAINISSFEANAKIYNNVFYGNQQGVSSSHAEILLYNNIFYLTSVGDQAVYHELDKLVSDNNIFYPEQDGFLIIDNKSFNKLDEYQSEYSLDIHSFTNDPEFQDIYNDNFTLKDASPAIDAGKFVGLLEDFYGFTVPYGEAPDIGSFEMKSTGTTLPVDDHPTDVFSVYPNPSSGIFWLKSQDINNLKLIEVWDASGKLIYSKENYSSMAENKELIDMSTSISGTYILTAKFNNEVITKRIIIQ